MGCSCWLSVLSIASNESYAKSIEKRVIDDPTNVSENKRKRNSKYQEYENPKKIRNEMNRLLLLLDSFCLLFQENKMHNSPLLHYSQ